MNDFLPNFDEIIKTADFNQVLIFSVAFTVAVLVDVGPLRLPKRKLGTLPHWCWDCAYQLFIHLNRYDPAR